MASGRLREHFYQIPSFNRMYPFCLTLKPFVPQPEHRNEIFPTTDEVGDCPSEEEGGDGEEEKEPEEQGKGNWIRNSTRLNHC